MIEISNKAPDEANSGRKRGRCTQTNKANKTKTKTKRTRLVLERKKKSIYVIPYVLSTALKSHGKSATFRQHYYPEGAWGWVITFCCFLVNIFTYGLQFSYALLELEVVEHCHAHLTPTSPYAASVAAGYDNSALFAGAGLSTGFGGANVGWGEVTTGAGYGGVTGVGADVAEVEEANAKDQLRLNAGTRNEM